MASTMEAVHLSQRVPPIDARRVEYGTRKRGIIVRSVNRIPQLHSSRPSMRGCLFARANSKIAQLFAPPRLCSLIEGGLSISRFLRNSITSRTIGLIRSLIMPVNDDRVR